MIDRSRVVAAVLTALCVLAAAWPLTTIVQSGSWVTEIVLLVAMSTIIGVAGRALRVPLGALPLIQFGAVLAALGVRYGVLHLDPRDTVDAVRGLIEEASDTIRRYTAPAPATRGLSLVLAFAVPTLGIATEHLAVNYRMPALAGVPLLTTFLLSTSSTGHSLSPVYFVVLAVLWLMLLAQEDGFAIRRWSNMTARPTTPTRLDDRLGIGGHGSIARALGVLALVAALVVPAVIPHGRPVFLADGLGRGPGSGGTVSFSSTADIARDLQSRNQSPVMQFSTSDPNPSPLKVLVGGDYQDGQWTAPGEPASTEAGSSSLRLSSRPELYQSTALTLQVQDSELTSPQVAIPDNPLYADLGSVSWSYDPSNAQIYSTERASQYSITYVPADVALQPISSTIPSDAFPEYRQVPQNAVAQLRSTLSAIRLTGVPFNDAIAIQSYLRESGGFSYSLTLAPTRRGSNGAALDPLSNFLVTKQGYCVQFATAMIMMARQIGIPARMAMGFLPGTPTGSDTYQVVQADAHAWPELWFPGIGWTRFEPTPQTHAGLAPAYTATGSSAPTRSARPSQTTTQESSTSASSTSTSAAAPAGSPGRSVPIGSILRVAALVLGIAVLIALLAAALPAASRRRQHNRLVAGTKPADRVEAEWANLVDRLEDYGVPSAADRSPRGQRRHYTEAIVMDRDTREALGRATTTLERARYGAPGSTPRESTLDADGQAVLDAVRRSQSMRQRAAARLAPRSGRRQLRDWLRLRR